MLLKLEVEAQEIQLEGNALKEINAINEGKFQDNWRIAAEVGDIRNIIQSKNGWKVNWILQEANVRGPSQNTKALPIT